jgi:hypothetical protein
LNILFDLCPATAQFKYTNECSKGDSEEEIRSIGNDFGFKIVFDFVALHEVNDIRDRNRVLQEIIASF